VYLFKKNSTVFFSFKELEEQVELETEKYIKCLRTNKGGEYVDDELLAFSKQKGILR